MKVLQINSVCGFGSTGRIATDLYDAIVKNGDECLIAYGRGKASDKYNTYKIGSRLNNYIHGFESRLFDNHGFSSRIATIKFIKKIKEYQPDVIHLHNLHGYYINIKILFNFLKEYDIPVVWTLHDCWAFTGHCCHYTYNKCYKWETQCCKCKNKNIYPSSLLFDQSKNNYKKKKEIFTGLKKLTIITPSNWLAKEVKKSFLKEYPIKVINNGIDLNIFKPTKSNFRTDYKLQDKIIILGVANLWNQKKGYNDFFDLARQLDNRYIIVMIGLTKKQINNLPSNILGITRTNNMNELAEIYSAADVFFNPSQEETLGLVTAEALACGIPAIVYRHTAIPEVIDINCGIVIKDKDIFTLINYIDNLSKEIKILCINRAKLFNKDIMFERYMNEYKK